MWYVALVNASLVIIVTHKLSLSDDVMEIVTDCLTQQMAKVLSWLDDVGGLSSENKELVRYGVIC